MSASVGQQTAPPRGASHARIDTKTRSESATVTQRRKAPPQEATLDERKPRAQPVKGAKKDHTSTVVSLIGSDHSNQGSGRFPTTPMAATRAASSQERVDNSLEESRVADIATWLAAAIGCKPVPAEMDVYARNVYALGIHSIKMIFSSCTKEHVEEFVWIKKFHKVKVAAALSLPD